MTFEIYLFLSLSNSGNLLVNNSSFTMQNGKSLRTQTCVFLVKFISIIWTHNEMTKKLWCVPILFTVSFTLVPRVTWNLNQEKSNANEISTPTYRVEKYLKYLQNNTTKITYDLSFICGKRRGAWHGGQKNYKTVLQRKNQNKCFLPVFLSFFSAPHSIYLAFKSVYHCTITFTAYRARE